MCSGGVLPFRRRASHVGGSDFGWDMTVSGQRLCLIPCELNWDAEFSLQRVKQIPVSVRLSTVLSLFGQFSLKHSDLSHCLVYIADLCLDQVEGIIDGVPGGWVADGVLGHPPVVPGKNGIVDWILKVANKAEGKLLPVLITVVVVSEELI